MTRSIEVGWLTVVTVVSIAPLSDTVAPVTATYENIIDLILHVSTIRIEI